MQTLLTLVTPFPVEAVGAVAHLGGRLGGVDVDALAAQAAVVVVRALVAELAARARVHLVALAAAQDVEAVARTCLVVFFAWSLRGLFKIQSFLNIFWLTPKIINKQFPIVCKRLKLAMSQNMYRIVLCIRIRGFSTNNFANLEKSLSHGSGFFYSKSINQIFDIFM